MKKYAELTVINKIHVKQFAINFYGQRWHTSKPNFCNRLSETQVCSVLSYCNTRKERLLHADKPY